MSHYVGLDVSVKSVSICVIDGEGSVLARGEVSSDPDQIAAFVLEHAPDAARVVHESGILSIWLTRETMGGFSVLRDGGGSSPTEAVEVEQSQPRE